MVAGATLLGILVVAMILPLLAPFLLCGAGVASARLYSGRSSEPLSTAAGARLGWMTGLWLFLVVFLVLAVTAIYVSDPARLGASAGGLGKGSASSRACFAANMISSCSCCSISRFSSSS